MEPDAGGGGGDSDWDASEPGSPKVDEDEPRPDLGFGDDEVTRRRRALTNMQTVDFPPSLFLTCIPGPLV